MNILGLNDETHERIMNVVNDIEDRNRRERAKEELKMRILASTAIVVGTIGLIVKISKNMKQKETNFED